MSDNTTAITDVNNTGVIKSQFCNEIEKKKLWCVTKYVGTPGTQNTEADSFSRILKETIEWKLNTHLFSKNFANIWKSNIRPFCITRKSPN